MSKSDPAAMKKERNKTIRWVVTIFLVTIVISGTISFVSDEIMSTSGILTAFLILLVIIFVGIIFDIIGMIGGNDMKKALAIVLVCMMVILAACGGSEKAGKAGSCTY